ncbi:RNA polymerase II elongation factor Ell [Anthonomus grandis grandis]|uniref:RNA polymerase II elongation factor Ell n=1 Tax=Anthonomus grandis grandis TaxID=2921223 RepID=UPI0021661A0B|nr:RNA polymerase II elongation factor Ell [Anthonomus grandis grandis]
MAALCPGVQYGLSSQQNFSENKDLIFVRLTDSALRAIEEYIRNPNKSNYQSPRIRFLGNENGELSFPSQHNESGRTLFSFNMSSADDMGGPVGSFECIQGTPPRSNLESLGNVRYKIRVNANEDIYEATRNRMNEVEDKYKNKCTREIKPNQTDIGRRVKVKQPVSHQPQPPPPRSSMRDSLMKQPSSYQSPPVVKPPLSLSQPSAHSSLSNGISSNGLGSNHVSSSQRSTVQHNRKPSVPEVAKRSLRERLVHLLALRPFKKYELHERLTKEGLRGASSISQVLKQIANLKDNCYYLNRNIWNEVNEDWPFYTETEKQILKRRKPQNLTPPGGSDGGSSGSGQSPTSTHPGSPPLITSTNSINGSGSGTKRPPYNEGGCGDGFPYKRQRIAHGGQNSAAAAAALAASNGANKGGGQVMQPATQQPSGFGDGQFGQRQQTSSEPVHRPSESTFNRSPIEQNNSQRRPITDLRDASNMNPRSRESPPDGFFNSYDNLPVTEDERNKRQCDSANGLTYGVSKEKPFKSGSPINSGLMTEEARRGTGSPVTQNPMSNGLQRDKDRRNNNNHKVSSSSHRISRVSPDSQTEGLPLPAQKSPVKEERPESPLNSIEKDWLDFKKQYVRISSAEQKKAYKADFNKDYTEYKNLYPIVEAVSQRFVRLDESLKRQAVDSPTYKSIKKEIVREYNKIKKDQEHQKAKKRFQYLHEKLSHIKKLVSDYDQAQTGMVQC